MGTERNTLSHSTFIKRYASSERFFAANIRTLTCWRWAIRADGLASPRAFGFDTEGDVSAVVCQ